MKFDLAMSNFKNLKIFVNRLLTAHKNFNGCANAGALNFFGFVWSCKSVSMYLRSPESDYWPWAYIKPLLSKTYFFSARFAFYAVFPANMCLFLSSTVKKLLTRPSVNEIYHEKQFWIDFATNMPQKY